MGERIIEQKKCRNCGKNIEYKWDFCPYCKEKQVKIKCIFCKNDLEHTWKFCPYCKSKANSDNRDVVLESGNEWLKTMLKK